MIQLKILDQSILVASSSLFVCKNNVLTIWDFQNEQQKLLSDCANAQSDRSLCCSEILMAGFFCDLDQIDISKIIEKESP